MPKTKLHYIGKERGKRKTKETKETKGTKGTKGTKQRPEGLERTGRKKEKIWKKVLTKGIRFDIIAKLT